MTVEDGVFDDRRAVTFRLTQSSASTLQMPQDGTLTSSTCTAGAALHSGTSMFSINDHAVLSLHTSIPLYRPLAIGTQGNDVRSLHDALRDLGYAAPDTDTFSSDSIAAFNALAEKTGAPLITADNGWSFNPAQILWQPASAMTIRQCPVRVGAQVHAGDNIAQTAPIITNVAIIRTPENADGQPAAGKRTVTISDKTFEIDDDVTQMNDPAFLNAIAASREYQSMLSGSGSGVSASSSSGASPQQSAAADGSSVDVIYQWSLAEPRAVSIVPPSALTGVSSGKGCVTVDGRPQQVTIVASQLGRSMVSPQSGTLEHVDVPADKTVSCR
ncbi:MULTISPECIES: hypothetical protein [Bifidobacterium]|nr:MULTISPECIES: hypothetical protein [Bifidobacterium]